MGIERLEACTERGFVEKFVRYIEDSIEAHLKRHSCRFVLGLSGTETPKSRKRMAEVFSTLGESDRINWARVCVFLTDERYGVESTSDASNAHLVRSTLVAALQRRDIAFENQLCIPRTDFDTAQRCAADYQTRLLNLFKAEGVDGPHVVAVGLGVDRSLAGVFPSWYRDNPERWAETVSKSLKVLSTESSTSEIPQRICVNLGVIRRSRHIVVNINESTDDAWAEVVAEFEAHSDPYAAKTYMRRRSGSFDQAREVVRSGSLPAVTREEPLERKFSASPGNKRSEAREAPPAFERALSPRGVVRLAPAETPLDYIMKYKHITVVQLAMDNEHHHSIIVLGAAGDLAKKKTFPSLFQLQLGQHLPESSRIIACDDPDFHKDVQTAEDFWEKRILPYLEQEEGWKRRDLRDFRNRIDFMPVRLSEPGTMRAVDARIKELAQGRGTDNRICYLALPSSLFAVAVQRLREDCFPEGGFCRVIIEKPFGKNLFEAKQLADQLGRHLDESQIYRMDHYLAKTLVLNILTLRFANREFGTLFHQYHVANVRITFQEDFGVEGRAGYFNSYGIIRDIMQNHLMQVLTLIAMEAPASLEAEDVRDEKVKVLKQIRPIEASDCVIGQYAGYQEDPQIQRINEENGYESRCPTFATCILYLDNERWSGVPFIMKAGKALKTSQTLVRVQFKKATPHSLFGDQPQNELVIRIQPNEAIYYKMIAKMPGISQKAKDVRRTVLDLDLKKGLERQRVPSAYEKLIYDVIKGESHNFVRRDELELSWRIFDPLLRKLEEEEKRVPLKYERGSGGPHAADELMESVGFQKYTPTGVAVSGFADDEVA
eukprot:TRINITY_DN14109_c0_g2_i1.p1 TRINITY_DN14109_c0_g2~~TRINITY_DN14109_c0_g2_i1.p1  ORF type:complete len:831 (-),score=147.34 TRINITY_DN14109_c0_g2_i1:103-2595(-)